LSGALHLENGKRSSAFSSAKVSSLEEISVFTENDDMPLGNVFDKIFDRENGGPAIDPKSDPEKLKKYFEEIVPEYSREKVYLSDIKKIVMWYNILQKKDMLVREEPEKPSETDPAEPENKETLPEVKKKKAGTKKTTD
jgi:hypothetical protein